MSNPPKIIGLKTDGLGRWALATVDDVNSGTVLYTRAEDGDRLWAQEDTLFQTTLDMKTNELRAEVERLRSALRFYADQNNYEGRGDIWGDGPVYPPLVFEDKGGRARAALEDKSNEPREAMAALNAARLEAHQR